MRFFESLKKIFVKEKYEKKSVKQENIQEAKKKLEYVPKSFDLIGSREKAVAIVEIPEELKGREKGIAESLMEFNKNVKTVLKKVSERTGETRIRNYELILGDPNTEVIHKEYGYSIKVDPQKVFFSPRESTERARIAGQVKKKEKVLVLFGGVGILAVAVAKKQPDIEKAVSVEINQEACKYAEENIRINKLGHKLESLCQDAKDFCESTKEKFDRIAMPLPLDAINFFQSALRCAKDGGTIHLYAVGEEENLFEPTIQKINEVSKKAKKKIVILNQRKVLPYAPRKYKIVFDIQVGGLSKNKKDVYKF